MPEEQEPRYQEVIHSIKYAEEPVEEEVAEESSNELEGVDLNDPQQLANYYMAKSGQVDPDQLEVEKKEEELRADKIGLRRVDIVTAGEITTMRT